MRLSLSELRRIIREEAEAGEAPPAADAAPDAAPEAAPEDAPPAGGDASGQGVEPDDAAIDVVNKIGLSVEPDGDGGDTPGLGLARFITMLEQQSPGAIAKLGEPAAMSTLIQVMGDNLTVEILEITNVRLEGMPTKEELRQRLEQGGRAPSQ